MKFKLNFKDTFLIEWIVFVVLSIFIQTYVGNNLGILIAILMMPMLIHDILLIIIIDYKEVKQTHGKSKNIEGNSNCL